MSDSAPNFSAKVDWFFPTRVSLPTDTVARQRVSIRRARYHPITPLGSAIVLKASEFLPGAYNPRTHTALEHIARAIDYACEQFGIDLAENSSWEVPLSTIGDGGISTEFFTAGATIVGSLVSFTDSLASRLVETMEFSNGSSQEWISADINACITRLQKDGLLRQKWEKFFLQFAGLRFKDGPEEAALTTNQTTVKYQLTSAMEIFVLGREYARHIIRRNRNALSAVLRSDQEETNGEFIADEFAWTIGRFLGSIGFAGSFSRLVNPWMESGAGAVAVLTAVEAIRRTREILSTGKLSPEETYACPTHTERLCRLEDVTANNAGPKNTDSCRRRRFLGRLIPLAYSQRAGVLPAAHAAGYRPKNAELHNAAIRSIHEGKGDDGLVEIISKLAGDFTITPNETPLSILTTREATSNSTTDLANKLKLSAANLDGIAVREYLGQRQDRSIREFADHAVITRIGTNDPKVSKLIAERLSFGRNVGPKNGLQECLDMYSYWIEATCEKLGLPLHGGVACGLTWGASSEPLQQYFFDADVSRIEIPEWTMMLCHFFSKLLARTAKIRIEGKRLAVTISPERLATEMSSNLKFRKYAADFIAYCATWDNRLFSPMSKTTGKCKTVQWHLLTASELFLIGHEYGHHILQHKTNGSAGVSDVADELMIAQELAADEVGGLITAHIGADIGSPFLHSGVGAVLVLCAVDLVRRARSILSTGVETSFVSKSHPALKERIRNLGVLRYDPRNVRNNERMRDNFEQVMEKVWTFVLPELQRMHARGIRPLSSIPNDLQWLRFACE